MFANLFRMVITVLLFGMSMTASALLISSLVLTPQRRQQP